MSRTAAVVAASDLRGRLRSSAKARTWQQKVIRYDREGPSVAGYYLDTVQLLATLCPLIGERREADGTWSRVNDPVVTRAIASFSSPMYSTAELFALPVRRGCDRRVVGHVLGRHRLVRGDRPEREDHSRRECCRVHRPVRPDSAGAEGAGVPVVDPGPVRAVAADVGDAACPAGLAALGRRLP